MKKLILVLLGNALLVTGCATSQLKPDFAGFSTAYADNMNWQMLLNLARLDQGHPAYFMAIGEIRLGRNQSVGGTLGTTSSHTKSTTVAAAVSNTVTDVLSGTLTPNTATSASPTFVFIPLNSEETARQLLSPISTDVFNTLYQQGWPADQLLRVLVERIEVDIPAKGERPAQRIVLTNSPTRTDPLLFATFLRVCEIVHELQRNGGLTLVGEERFSALSQAEVESISAKEVNEAADKGRAWQKSRDGGGWQLGTRRLGYRFQADRKIVGAVLDGYKKRDPDYRITLDNLSTVLSATVAEVAEDAPASNGPRSTLILRSFRNVLEAVAAEQRAFDELARDAEFRKRVPSRQLRPVLQLDWQGVETPLAPPAIQLDYAGQRYQITDPIDGPASNTDSRWNRDVFRLLVNLSSQVTVDITKFQRQVLEVN